jgi:hypothetical protein
VARGVANSQKIWERVYLLAGYFDHADPENTDCLTRLLRARLELRDDSPYRGAMSESRRVFLGSVAAGFAASAAQSGDKRNGIPYRNLGRTGEKVSAVGIGGFHIGNPRDEQETIRLTRSAIDQGINFMDNCWDYHDGESERRMGKALRDGYRKRVFLMSKIDGQTRDAASKQIDESLERLQTEMVDLMQFHEMIRPNDPDRVFAKGGSFEAMLAAQKAGKIRYIGFTGHKDPEIHLKMIQTGLDRARAVEPRPGHHRRARGAPAGARRAARRPRRARR